MTGKMDKTSGEIKCFMNKWAGNDVNKWAGNDVNKWAGNDMNKRVGEGKRVLTHCFVVAGNIEIEIISVRENLYFLHIFDKNFVKATFLQKKKKMASHGIEKNCKTQ